MADRRTDDTPLAPHRSLGKRAKVGDEDSSPPSQPASTAARTTTRANSTSQTESVDADGGPPTETNARAVSARPSGGTTTRVGGATAPRPSSRATPRPTASKATSSSSRRTTRAARPQGSRKARLRLTHVDPWSVMKIAFLLSIAIGIVTVVAVGVVWAVLDAAGVWDSINGTVQDVLGSQSGSTFDIETYLGTSRVMGFTMIVAVVDVVLITAIATLGAFLYNLSAALLGGLEVTLAEDDN